MSDMKNQKSKKVVKTPHILDSITGQISLKNSIWEVITFFLLKLGLFGTLKLALALQFIVTNAYFSVARTLTLVLHATLK